MYVEKKKKDTEMQAFKARNLRIIQEQPLVESMHQGMCVEKTPEAIRATFGKILKTK